MIQDSIGSFYEPVESVKAQVKPKHDKQKQDEYMKKLSTAIKRKLVTNKTINSDLDLDSSGPISYSAYGAKGQAKP